MLDTELDLREECSECGDTEGTNGECWECVHFANTY